MGKLKRFGLFLLLIIIVVALAPLITGILFKRSYIAFLEANSQGTVQIQEYHLGWLSSDAKIYYPLAISNTNSKVPMPTGFTLVQHIVHGPYLLNPWTNVHDLSQVAIQTVVHLDAKSEDFLLGPAASEGVMQINTSVSFLNHYSSQIQSPIYHAKLPPAGKISWQGISGTTEADMSGNRISHLITDIQLGAMDAENNNFTFSTQPISISVDVACANNGLCTGTEKNVVATNTRC